MPADKKAMQMLLLYAVHVAAALDHIIPLSTKFKRGGLKRNVSRKDTKFFRSRARAKVQNTQRKMEVNQFNVCLASVFVRAVGLRTALHNRRVTVRLISLW